MLGTLASVDLVLERGKEFVVDESDQLAAGDLWLFLAVAVGLVRSPVAPAESLGQR